MATLIDSNIIIDLLERGSPWKDWARGAIGSALSRGGLIYNVVIAAEVAHAFKTLENYNAVFVSALWTFENIPAEAAPIAGWAHRDYRARGGGRAQTLPDFLIGAHASVAGHRLMTRDTRRYRTYFPQVELVTPESHS
ncbi:type II toxin-antitoxin system VapC family toxin [Oryzicola mucosus]|uniref:Type II toxin-antitoxin system VapC family toxin n=1 Tax=Oryzicola mucosus TaxID=2767425 RepID=A0A8J6U6V0_9HYPH|nr:type II toxin-antitoxin system VapC family toxin [Oryzicola mucosus]MBD0413817.1 type II toxin-antitoxin system VapC family toxin [Oryzicola mucosus]